MLNTERPYCAQWDPRGEGLHVEHAGASICTEERDGNTPLMQGALRGQLDLIALREHVCWSKLVEPLREGAGHLPLSKAGGAIWGLGREATTLSKPATLAHG